MDSFIPDIHRGPDHLAPIPGCTGDKFAYLINTKNVFLVSDQFYHWLKDPGGKPNSDTATIDSDIKRLKALGFWDHNPTFREVSESYISISLHLVHGCNLACSYCNVQQGTYGDPFSFMDWTTAESAIDFLAQIRNGRTPRLIFYGGEPLLNWNILTRAAKKMVSIFSEPEMQLVTNGTLIDQEKAKFLSDYNIFTIISIDGPKEVHDRNRPMLKARHSSYERARYGLEHLKNAGAPFHIRATWAPEHDSYDHILAHLIEMAGESRMVTIAIRFDQAGTAAMEKLNDILRDKYREAEENNSSLPSSTYQYLDQVLRADWAPVPRCEAGHAGFSINPRGDIYPCQVSVSMKRYRLGTVWDGIDLEGEDKISKFLEPSSPICNHCWARHLCSGPCRYSTPIPDNWPYCKMVKLQIMEALKFVVRTSDNNLMRICNLPGFTENRLKALKRGVALREILWKTNHHIKPISLCPQPVNHV